MCTGRSRRQNAEFEVTHKSSQSLKGQILKRKYAWIEVNSYNVKQSDNLLGMRSFKIIPNDHSSDLTVIIPRPNSTCGSVNEMMLQRADTI